MKHFLLRRDVLAALVAVAGSACSGAPPLPPKPVLTPLHLDTLEGLVPGGALAWMVRVKPRIVSQIPWLIPSIGRVVPEENLDRFQRGNGLDLRQVPEALLLKLNAGLDHADAQIVRHTSDPLELERRFFARLTTEKLRAEDRPDVVRLSGRVGRRRHVFARLGPDVVVYQQGGDVARGPARVASLYAQGKLRQSRTVLSSEPLKSLAARFGPAPVVALAVGPFEDEWKRAAKGLLEIATAVGAAARPTARENLGLSLAITAEFGDAAADAAEVLRAAWDDIALSTLGALLGLDRPIEPPLVAHDRGVVAIAVEIEPNRFAKGLEALVKQDLEAIMKLD